MPGISLMFSIANALAFGFVAFTLIQILRGKFRQVAASGQ
jgi:xanthine/uracil/vitamin C permease (AzgA family)